MNGQIPHHRYVSPEEKHWDRKLKNDECGEIVPGGGRCRLDPNNEVHKEPYGKRCPFCQDLLPNDPKEVHGCDPVGLTQGVPRQEDEAVDHPVHYGGAEDPFEHIKVAEAKGWGYHIGNCTKYLWRAGIKTPGLLQDLKKAKWYLDRYIAKIEAERNSHPHPPEWNYPHPSCRSCQLLGGK